MKNLNPSAVKARIRNRIRALMKREKVARLRRPLHDRIPNFVGTGRAAQRLAELDIWKRAKLITANPDPGNGFAEAAASPIWNSPSVGRPTSSPSRRRRGRRFTPCRSSPTIYLPFTPLIHTQNELSKRTCLEKKSAKGFAS